MGSKKICGIYKITNKVNGKVYIGQSVDVKSRWRGHLYVSHNENHRGYNLPLYCSIRKHGKENFKFEILEVIEDKSLLNEREMYYIKIFNSFIYDENSNGYNCTVGGDGSGDVEMPMETRLKIGNNRIYTYGADNKSSKQVFFDGKTYGSALELCDTFGFKYKNIISYLNHSNAMPVEYYVLGMRYLDQNTNKYKIGKDKNIQNKAIWLDGVKFKNATLCSEYCEVDAKTLRSWVSGARKMPKSFYDRGLRYAHKEMCDYTHQEELLNVSTNKKIIPQSIQVYCDGMLFYSKYHFSNYYNLPYSTVAGWFNKSNINKKYAALGLREISIDEANGLIKNNKLSYAAL